MGLEPQRLVKVGLLIFPVQVYIQVSMRSHIQDGTKSQCQKAGIFYILISPDTKNEFH